MTNTRRWLYQLLNVANADAIALNLMTQYDRRYPRPPLNDDPALRSVLLDRLQEIGLDADEAERVVSDLETPF